MYNILVIGAVGSTLQTLSHLIKHDFNVVGVLGYEPLDTNSVSGWVDLKSFSKLYNIPYKGFIKINDIENIEWAVAKRPDIIFAVGFSQLISEKWLEMPTLGCVGFHPTKLPQGRGRAPLAWIILEQMCGSATFFLMGKEADSGPIFIQEIFPVEAEDDATTVGNKINNAIGFALDNWLPQLKNGIWNPVAQDESEASWYGKRSEEDGLINWDKSSTKIDRLIKSATHPHPGAYTFFKKEKILIWSCQVETKIPIKGVTGRILIKDIEKGYLVQCGEGLIWINHLEGTNINKITVGSSLKYNLDDEITSLWKEIENLKIKFNG